MSAYPILSATVRIDSTNNVIRFSESGVSAGAEGSATVASGTYQIGSLLTAVKTALDGYGAGGNTYSVSISYSQDPASPGATVTISRTAGTSTFKIWWASSSNTFPPEYLGFAAANTADNASNKVSTLTPSVLWVGTDLVESRELRSAYASSAPVATSGFVKPMKRAGPHYALDVAFRFVAEERVRPDQNTSDPNATIMVFLGKWLAGSVQIHLVSAATSTTLSPPSGSNDIDSPGGDDLWVIDPASVERFAPRRVDIGMPLYDFDLSFLEWVTA